MLRKEPVFSFFFLMKTSLVVLFVTFHDCSQVASSSGLLRTVCIDVRLAAGILNLMSLDPGKVAPLSCFPAY